jgi:Ni2+-binding GTPase involved in maturation of urease and hydrogenase
MTIHVVTGFLGSGKTTAIQMAVGRLKEQGSSVGVITNDQGTHLVDGGLVNSLGTPNVQVKGGCFCCRYEELDLAIQQLQAGSGVEQVFAEAVGSCTDIVATVLKPLFVSYPGSMLTVSTFADIRLLNMILNEKATGFDDGVKYIYSKQLEEAGLIVVTKTDLVTEEELAATRTMMEINYGGKQVLYQNSFNKAHIGKWLQELEQQPFCTSAASLSIDYDIYAGGEARLAWLDQELEIFSAANDASSEAEMLAHYIYASVTANGYPVGHLKFLINGSQKMSFTSGKIVPSPLQHCPAGSSILLINLRVQAAPGQLQQLVAAATRQLEIQTGAKTVVNSIAAFQPGYPRPTHRL